MAWPAQRGEFCALVGVPVGPDAALARAQGELHTALGELDEILATGRDLVRFDEAGELVIGPLMAEDLPAEVAELREELTALLPFAPIVSVFIKLDRHTRFLDCFTHAGGATPRSPELKRNLLAVRRRHLQDQTEQVWCLTVATNAISTWTAEYLGLAVQQFWDQGRLVDDTLLAHISPVQSESIGLFGTIIVDIDAELAQLGLAGHRPLRQPATGVP